jgi:dipeptidyl aminopeptidase/acylaminoacyl peptidase
VDIEIWQQIISSDPSFLLIHCTRDDIPEYQQSEDFVIVLQDAGGEVEAVLLPNGNHSHMRVIEVIALRLEASREDCFNETVDAQKNLVN